jgi:hypothetical protein
MGLARLSFALSVVIFGVAVLTPLPAPGSPGQNRITACVTERFAAASEEVPDLRRHVIPLLAKLGCSAASCHGAKGGQAGFQLSLFGFDYNADLIELADEGDPPRANWKEPTKSLLIDKPTLREDHLGGKHFEHNSWQCRLLLNWISARAPSLTPADQQTALVRLQIAPQPVSLSKEQRSNALKVVAYWSDGSAEDVTPLCRFQSNDPSVAEVDREGVVTRKRAGDTDIIIFYDQAVASTPVYAPHGSKRETESGLVRSAIDSHVEQKLDLLGMQPSSLCSDEEFLRRASLDATGTLPTVETVERFRISHNPNKRVEIIDELLASPEYAAWWATWLCELTGNAESVMPAPAFRQEQSRQWYEWLYKRVAANTPFDQIAAGLIEAGGRQQGESYTEYSARMTSYVSSPDGQTLFADQDAMPHFWARRNVRGGNAKALAFSYVFLGVQLQCAECHKHPFDRWTKDDFDGLKRFFEPLRYGHSPDAAADYQRLVGSIDVQKGKSRIAHFATLARQGQTVPWDELYYDDNATFGSSRLSLPGNDAGAAPMRILMQWMRGLDHPYLAMSFVNRVWHHYFGVGIVDPPDDLSLANPPSNEALLDYLTNGFVQSGYDMRWLHREILNSQAYQRSWRPNELNKTDTRNFSHAHLRRLPAEVLLDAIYTSTASNQERAIRSSARLIGAATGLTRSDSRGRILRPIGMPSREAICTRERRDEPNLSQALFLQNDPLVQNMLASPDGWLASLDDALDPTEASLDKYIREAFLRVLSRLPTDSELLQCRRFASASRSHADGIRGILWALLNSKEFCLN